MLTGVVTASRPAGAGWEADLRIGETTITCRLPDKPPVAGAKLTVTVLDPPYFKSDGDALPSASAEAGLNQPEQLHRL